MKNQLKQQLKLLIMAVLMGFAIASCKKDEPKLSSAADITKFSFAALNPAVTATISGTTITATVLYNQDVMALVPTIEVSAKASVQPASGAPQNFMAPVTYTVTAEDGTKKVYTVTITKQVPPVLAITPVWQKNLNAGGVPSWFTPNNDRDLAVFGSYVYIHNNNDRIRVMSTTDGSDVTAGGATGFIDGKQNFAQGNLFLAGTAVDSKGKIIASNLRVGSATSDPWNVYRWNDKDAAQELLFQYPTPTGFRLGNNITVVGDVTANASVFAPSSGGASNKILIFNIVNGIPNTTPVIIELQGLTGLGNAADVSLVSNNASSNMIVSGTGVGNIAEYTQAGVFVGKIPEALKEIESTKMLFSFALDVAAFEIKGRKVIAATSTDYTIGNGPADKGFLYLIDYTDGWNNITESNIKRIPFTLAGGIDKNVNATGGVSVIVNADGNSAVVYAMLTNFGVGAFTVTFN